MIHVVLPVHDRLAVTADFIAALLRQTCSNYRLWLVDDGCRDGTVAHVRACVPDERLRVLGGDGQLWWAGALQMAFEALRAEALPATDAVLLINDDVSFAPDFLARGLEVLAEHPEAAIQAVGVDRDSGSVDRGAVANLVTLSFRAATVGEAPNCLSTRGLLMRAPTFVKSGGFRPARLPHYMSDYEFTLRLRRQGVVLRCDDRFRAVVRLDLTGSERSARPRRLGTFLKTAFSNRAKYNPAHWSAFALMVCPPWVAPLQVLRIWLRFALSVAGVALAQMRGAAAPPAGSPGRRHNPEP